MCRLPELIIMIFVGLSLFIPVTALTARFILKPMLEDLVASLREGRSPASPETEDRLEVVEARLLAMEKGLERLQSVQDFDRALGAPTSEG